MNRPFVVVTGVLALAGCSKSPAVGVSQAEPGARAEITRKIIERTPIVGTDEELRLMLIEYPPGAAAAPHRHPVIGLCYVIQGMAESQYEGEGIRTLRAGDSYQDSATQQHLVFRNALATEPLLFTCAAKIGKDQEFAQPL
jgi:quercetin dioxygenase-like cupin family protein